MKVYGQLERAQAENRPSDYSGGTATGLEWINTTDNKLKFDDGSQVRAVVTENGSATLTAKTIDADSNTITNIEDADIKAGAAIQRGKLANGTADHVLINNGSGGMSSEATLSRSRGGCGQDMSAVTFPTTGALTTNANTQTLSNKSFSDSITVAHIATPANPSSGNIRVYAKNDNRLYTLDSAGVETPVGSGGGGGGSLNWTQVEGIAPLTVEENAERVFLFETGLTQQLTAFVRVPSGYISGRQISMFLGFYSPSSSNRFQMRVTATLVRKNTDAITSTTNQLLVSSGDVVNTVANQLREVQFNISSGSGAINSVAISAGDMIKLELVRISATTAEDTADVRFIPNFTEVRFT